MALDTSGLYTTWPIGSEVRADAKDIASAGADYRDLIVDTQGTWTALESHFTEPAEQVQTASSSYDDLIVHGVVIGNATKDIEAALITFGDAVDDLQRDRRIVKQRAREYNAAVAAGDEIPETGPESEASIQWEINRVVNALQAAMDTCAESINAIEASLDTDQFPGGPAPAAVQYAVGEGLDALDVKTVTYSTFTTVDTISNRNWANRLRNSEVSFDGANGFPWVNVDRPPGETHTTHMSSSSRSSHVSNYIMPTPALWMTKIPGRVGDFYQSKLDGQGRPKRNVNVEVNRSPWFSRNPSTTTTTTTSQTSTSTSDATGRWSTVGKWAGRAGVVGDVVGFGFMYHDEGAKAREEVYQGEEYSHLSSEELEAEVNQRQNVAAVTNTGIDLTVAGGAALAGAAVGGPVGAAVGFVGGVAVTAFLEWEVFDGKSAKDVVSDTVNDGVDWVQDKWDSWF